MGAAGEVDIGVSFIDVLRWKGLYRRTPMDVEGFIDQDRCNLVA